MVAAPTLPGREPPFTANDRLKMSSGRWFWGSLAGAAVLHFAVLTYWPAISIADWRRPTVVPVAVTMPEHRLPPPPAELPRPQAPTPGAIHMADDVTLPEIGELVRTRPELPPPPVGASRGEAAMPFTPYTVAPELRAAQRAELRRYLERNYPAALRDAGIGARAVLWVHIDTAGVVRESRLVQSSGYAAFDDLARDAIARVRFAPAVNLDQRVPVWVQLPIQFEVR